MAATIRGRGRLVGVDVQDRTCSITGCTSRHKALGWCRTHYNRWLRTGDVGRGRPEWQPEIARVPIAVEHGTPCLPSRIWDRICVTESGCWKWTGHTERGGYGKVYAGGRTWTLHCLTYTVFVGQIPDGLQMDHFRFPDAGCIGRTCCRPDHVRPTTPRENILRSDGVAARNLAKTHCAKDHPLSGSNLYLHPDGGRVCKTCRLDNQRCSTRRRRAVATRDQGGRDA